MTTPSKRQKVVILLFFFTVRRSDLKNPVQLKEENQTEDAETKDNRTQYNRLFLCRKEKKGKILKFLKLIEPLFPEEERNHLRLDKQPLIIYIPHIGGPKCILCM